MSKSVQLEVRPDLWKRVEALAKRRGISTDEVVQAALVQLFSRKKGAGSGAATAPPKSPPKSDAPARKKAPAPKSRPAPGSGPRGMPKPGGGRAAAAPAARQKSRALYLFCEGQWYTIDQDQFVIGRGSKYSDLPIKDANISRRHCAVVRRDSEYFIKDLGSTNGIEFNGERVDDHQINDGTTYYLCDHELRFTFTAPG
jgi:hypothetical protein